VSTLDAYAVRSRFKIFEQQVYGRSLIYLDSAATSQKPTQVVEAMRCFYEEYCANVHRGVHRLSEVATKEYEGARQKVANFIGAKSPIEVIFTRGTTEAINLVASSYGRANVRAGDEIIVSEMEHHSNIVPWQMLCEEKGARLRVAPIDDDGELIWHEYVKLLGPKTRIVAMTHVSNALGTLTPLKKVIEAAHDVGAIVVVDGAQAVPHAQVDVTDLDCDFYAFSAHKMYGPTGVGVLYGKQQLLEAMPPYQGGGDMIASVTFEKTTYAKLPAKFEAGTPNIAGVIGLGAAIDFMLELGVANIAKWEDSLLRCATEAVSALPGLKRIGTARQKASVLSFVLQGVHPHDISSILDRQGVAIRAGHLCAQPVMKRFGVPALVRASFAVYNTREDVDALVKGLQKVSEVF
jgi:cysteine desulfurase/selenocysteine lyase